jgi:hypothetical protein
VTDDSSDVVGNVSGERIGEGPGKDGTDLAGNSEDTTEGLATDSGSEILLAILVVETDKVVSAGELIVGEDEG